MYVTGAAGRAAYARARAKAKPRRPAADPQAGPPGPPAPDVVAVAGRPCATPLPGGGTCGTPALGHQLNRAGQRTYCCLATAAGRCPCAKYTPPKQKGSP